MSVTGISLRNSTHLGIQFCTFPLKHVCKNSSRIYAKHQIFWVPVVRFLNYSRFFFPSNYSKWFQQFPLPPGREHLLFPASILIPHVLRPLSRPIAGQELLSCTGYNLHFSQLLLKAVYIFACFLVISASSCYIFNPSSVLKGHCLLIDLKEF